MTYYPRSILAVLLVILGVQLAPASATAQNVQIGTAHAKPQIDPQAQILLRQMIAAYSTLSSYSSTVETKVVEEYYSKGTPPHIRVTDRWKVAYRKPNMARTERVYPLNVEVSFRSRLIVSDGNKLYAEIPVHKGHYLERSLPLNARGFILNWSGLSYTNLGRNFHDPDTIESDIADIISNTFVSLKLGRSSVLDGVPTDSFIVELLGSPVIARQTKTYAIGHTDHLLRKVVEAITFGTPYARRIKSIARVETETNVKAGQELPASTFVFTPPMGATPVDQMPDPPRSIMP